MKRKLPGSIMLMMIVVWLLSGCEKIHPVHSPGSPHHPPPQLPADLAPVKVKVLIRVGEMTYDSLPASMHIISWDSSNVAVHSDTMLNAGVNQIFLSTRHMRFQLSINKWGITDQVTVEKDQLGKDLVFVLGGSKAAKKLSREESFILSDGTYKPSSRIQYSYNSNRLSRVDFFQKRPQSNELVFTHKQLYTYSGEQVSRIDVEDSNGTATGYTSFTYDPTGKKLVSMQQKQFDVLTNADVQYYSIGKVAGINIHYLYNDGSNMEYHMRLKGGNMVDDELVSSTGASETGNYHYDFNINPFAHMNMPDIFMSGISRHNPIKQQKAFAGNIPAAVVYKYEYVYDADGYPLQVIRYFKSPITGEHLYQVKTVYTY